MKNFRTQKTENNLYNLLQNKLEEITYVSPQELGILTPWYKKITAPLKIAPWRILLPICFVSALFLRMTIGPLLVKIVSVLQSSF